MTLLDRVYERSPVFVQNVMATGYGFRQRMLRNRGDYPRFVHQLEVQQWWTLERLREAQDSALCRTVAFAAREVPYYRDLFAREKIRVEDIQTAADLKRLPFLDKAIVQEQGERLRPDRVRVGSIAHSTGGTTGRPVTYWMTPSAIQFNYAFFETRVRRWGGVTFGEKMVSLNGKPIVPTRQAGPPYWRHNLAFNQLYVSAYHLSDRNLPAIVDRIAAFEPRFIVAYVSAVHRIARFILEQRLAGVIRLSAVFVSSETLFEWQRADIEEAFACKVFNGYSLGEPVCAITECPAGSMHVSTEYGVVELVPDGDEFEVVATGLINDAMPLLRYRTGDKAVPGDDRPCSCGRGLPCIGKIIGRVDEMVQTPEGTAVGPAALSLAFQSVPNLRESQIIQDSPRSIVVKIAVSDRFTKANESFLIDELRKRLGATLEIEISYVPAIPRTVSGKQRLVITSLRR